MASGEARNVVESLAESLAAGVLFVDATTRIVHANRAFCTLFGRPRPELVGSTVAELIGVGHLDQPLSEAIGSRTASKGIHFSVGVPNHGQLTLRTSVVPLQDGLVPGSRGAMVIFEDTTAEAMLLEQAFSADRRFQEVVNHASDGIVLFDANGTISYANLAAERSFGWDSAELIGRSAVDLVATEVLRRDEQTMRRRFQEQDETLFGRRFESRARRRDGTTFPIEATLTSHRLDQELVYTLAMRDITERLSTERALKDSELGFRELIERTPDAVAVFADGRFLFVNPAMATLLDEPAETLVGRDVDTICTPEERPGFPSGPHDSDSTPPVGAMERHWLKRDGTLVTVEVNLLTMRFWGKPAWLAVGRDLTERKQLAARAMQLDRMVAVGTLAAGVGHEINNPMAYVISNLSHVESEMAVLAAGVKEIALAEDGRTEGPSGPLLHILAGLRELGQVVQEARDGADRVRRIVMDLKTFSRATEDTRSMVDVRKIIESSISLAWSELRHRAQLVREFDEIPRIAANEGRLGQVFLNLIINASHAIPEGNHLKHKVTLRVKHLPEWLQVEVSDTGCGISPEVMKRIFDPFFTTKPIGQGTGLGLSICQSIVEAHGGVLTVSSVQGEGTTFCVRLPKSAVVSLEKPALKPPAKKGRTGRVLVVDDEPHIRRSLARTLGNKHDVVTVGSGKEALDLITAGEHFDAILCDVMMPDMSGIDLHMHLKAFKPEVGERLVFMTGGAFTPRTMEYLGQVANPTLEKPFDTEVALAVLGRLVA